MRKLNEGLAPRWETEDRPEGFRHRIVHGDAEGAWATYGGIAILGDLRACTTVYEGSLPTECVFEVEVVSVRELWFYVPDYPAVRSKLEWAYKRFGVEEWSAEPGRVGDSDDDADVVVQGEAAKLTAFKAWLESWGTKRPFGLMIEGEPVG